MKNLFTILFLFLVSIYSIGCDSSNSSTNSSNCPINQSIGCDSNCAENPLQNDTCGVCGGNGSTCASSTIDILYNTTTDIGGFQFNIDGATVTGASGGAAANAGFTISTGVSTVLAFSFTGATIPAGNGVLVLVEIDDDANPACLDEQGVVLSDASGNALDVEIINCNTIKSSE